MRKCTPSERRYSDLQSDCVNYKILSSDNEEFMFIRTYAGQKDKIKKALKITKRLYNPASKSFKEIFMKILELKNVDYTEILCDSKIYLWEK